MSEGEKQRPFTMIDNEFMRRDDLSASAKTLYVILKGYVGSRTDEPCFPGQELLASHMKCSDRSIRNYLDELEGAGLLFVARSGNQRNNRYYLDFQRDLIERDGYAEEAMRRTRKKTGAPGLDIPKPEPLDEERLERFLPLLYKVKGRYYCGEISQEVMATEASNLIRTEFGPEHIDRVWSLYAGWEKEEDCRVVDRFYPNHSEFHNQVQRHINSAGHIEGYILSLIHYRQPRIKGAALKRWLASAEPADVLFYLKRRGFCVECVRALCRHYKKAYGRASVDRFIREQPPEIVASFLFRHDTEHMGIILNEHSVEEIESLREQFRSHLPSK